MYGIAPISLFKELDQIALKSLNTGSNPVPKRWNPVIVLTPETHPDEIKQMQKELDAKLAIRRQYSPAPGKKPRKLAPDFKTHRKPFRTSK